MNPQWHEPGQIPEWLLEHARRVDPQIEWDETHVDAQRIDAALAELQERAANPVDPAKAHQHLARQGKTVDRDEWFAAGYDPGCPTDWWNDVAVPADRDEDVL